jgi:lysine decarboxylase
MEMSDLYNIVAITTIGDNKGDYARLVSALRNIKNVGTRKAMAKAPTVFFKTPEASLMPWEAVYYEKEKIEAEKSVGRICGEMIIPYPPGIPALMPGEIISREVYEYLKLCLGEGVKINGASDAKLEKIWVIKDRH